MATSHGMNGDQLDKLVEEVFKHQTLLFINYKSQETFETKKKTWKFITDKLNSEMGENFTPCDIIEAWKDCVFWAKYRNDRDMTLSQRNITVLEIQCQRVLDY